MLEDVDIVDEVDQYDASSCFPGPAPGSRSGEVFGWFVECPETVDGDDAAQGVGFDQFLRLHDVGVEAAVVAD